jgi:hypothetical protein
VTAPATLGGPHWSYPGRFDQLGGSDWRSACNGFGVSGVVLHLRLSFPRTGPIRAVAAGRIKGESVLRISHCSGRDALDITCHRAAHYIGKVLSVLGTGESPSNSVLNYKRRLFRSFLAPTTFTAFRFPDPN